jgi:amino acid transporter
VYGSLGLLWPFAPMHSREVLAMGGGTMTDTMHLVLAGVTVVVMLLAILVGAAAFGRRFRVYSYASLVILVIFGALTFRDAPGVSANLPTPWIGVWERINVGAFLLWVVVLAVATAGFGKGNSSRLHAQVRAPRPLQRGRPRTSASF